MIALEISSTDIRLIETAGERVIRWASRSLEPGIFEDEMIADPRALSDAIKQLMTSSGIKGRNITASVSGLYSLSRVVMVSNPLGGTTTQQMILEAIEGVMPLSGDELYLSWQVIADVEGGQQVLVLGVPRDMLDSEMQSLKAAGVNPRVLDLKTMALARAVNREQALILNIEPTSLDMVIVAGGMAEVMRTTAWQPSDFSIEDEAEHLAVALELTVGFYNSHHPDLPLAATTPLFVTGGMSGDLSLMETLQARLEYPIEPLTPPLQYPEHLPVSQYAVNIGLALKGTTSAKSAEQGAHGPLDINLLPQVYRPWKPSAKQIYIFLAIVAAIALLIPLYQVTSDAMSKTATLRARHTAINSQLEVRRVQLKSREPLKQAINEYQTILDMGGGFIEDLNVINGLADELGIEVPSISHGGSSITFTCQADSDTIFRDYLAALEESGRFSSVSSPPYTHPGATGAPITLVPKPAE